MKPSFLISEVVMTTPCIICVAITGSLPTKDNIPAFPSTIAEQIESAHEAFETGVKLLACERYRHEKYTPTPVRP
jgi:uncharacterized protein (DUF849 family)